MKRLFVAIISIFLIILCISGCSKNSSIDSTLHIDLKNEYIEGKDNQYMYSDNWYGTPLQHGEGGYYYLKDSFLYFIDDETFEMYPLCNKSDCLHDKEKDETTKANCNAYIDCSYLPAEQKIQYYNGYIYYIYETTSDEAKMSLRKFEIQSQNIEDIVELNCSGIDDWIIHRGYFYYANSVVSSLDDEGNEYAKEQCALYRVNLDSKNSDTEIISNFEELGLSLQMTQNMHAYGNYIYYDANTVEKGTDILDADNDTFDEKRYCYDINNNKNFCLCDNAKGDSQYFFGFLNDKILYLSGKKCIYSCDLDGKNTTKLFDFEDKFWGYNVFTDGKYIYFENLIGEIGKYYVFDDNGKMLNVVKLPFEINPQVPYDTKYIVRYVEESNDIKMVDKSKIALSNELKAKTIYTFD